MKIYYFSNRKDSLGLNFGTSPSDGVCIFTKTKEEQNIDSYVELPDNVMIVSENMYNDILRNPGDYTIDKGKPRKITDKDIQEFNKLKEKKESEEKDKPENIRKERAIEFEKYNYYMLSLKWESLNDKQKSEYKSWYEAWLDAPATKNRPETPKWFKEKK